MNLTSTTKPAVRQVRILAMGVGLWAALVLLFVTQFVLVGSVSWRDALVHAVFFWGLWIVFMPAAASLAFRFPFEKGLLFQRLGIHLVGCVVVVTVSQFVLRNFIPLPSPPVEARRKLVLESAPPEGFYGLRAGLDILVYLSLLGVCQGVINFRHSQQRERRAAELEARLTRSKLQALRMQINPHFLFNTLNAISTLIYVQPRAADEMLGDLSELLRRSLDRMEEQENPLARELQFIRAYTSIEQKRFGERLRLEQHVPDELLGALVPALILQPLVENAIRHGIEPQRGPGLIVIQARRDGRNLHLLVKDDGKGLPPGGTHGPERHGIGLPNTQARLRELYGEDQQFTFANVEPHGCAVEIRLPFHTEPVQAVTASDAERL